MHEDVATRPVDNGAPLYLMDPPRDGVVAYAVATFSCNNPTCPCTRMHLRIGRVEETTNGELAARGPTVGAGISSDGSDLRWNGTRMNTSETKAAASGRASAGGGLPPVLASTTLGAFAGPRSVHAARGHVDASFV